VISIMPDAIGLPQESASSGGFGVQPCELSQIPRLSGRALVGCAYAGAESIRINRAAEENVRWRTTDSIARRERSWSNSLRVRGFGAVAGQSQLNVQREYIHDGGTIYLVPQYSSDCHNILGDQCRLDDHSFSPADSGAVAASGCWQQSSG
jgi:hypothetical protein